MLNNDFFTFGALQTDGDLTKTNLTLNAAHPIFKGHFPDQPIVPGACMMQMVKEVLEAHLGKLTRLAKASDLKFLSFIDPVQNEVIQLEMKIKKEEDGSTRIDARLMDGEHVLFKFKGVFVER